MRERAAFVGRARELAALDAAWRRALGGERRVVLLGGEPGIGKSTLAARFLSTLDVPVLRARCTPGGGPFGPFVAALGGVMPAVIPSSSSDPEAARFQRFEAFGAALEERGSVLLLEDLHEADGSSLALLDHLARAPASRPFLFVGTYRRAELALHERLSAAVEGLRRDGLLERVSVAGLSEDEVVALGGSADVFSASGGNPLHVEELLLSDEPAGLRTLIGRRLARLTPPVRIALSAAAVLGRSFDPAVALEVARQEVGFSEAAEFVRDGEFVHDLVVEILLSELTPMRRAALHRAALAALEERSASVFVLAHHALRAGDGDPAVAYASAAASSLVDALAFEAGAELYEQALDALGPWNPVRRADLLLALGDARSRAGDVRSAREAFAGAFRSAEQLEDASRRALAALGFAGRRGARFGEPDDDAAALLEAALAGLPDAEFALRARVVARLAEARYGEGDVADSLSAEALTLAYASDDPVAIGAAASARVWSLWVPGRASERLTVAAALEDVGLRSADVERVGEGLTWSIGARLELGDLDGAAVDIESYARRDGAGLDPEHSHALGVFRGLQSLVAGQFAEAESRAVAAAAAAPGRSRPDVVQLLAVQLFAVRAEQDRLHEVRPAVAEYIDSFPSTSVGWRAVLALCDIRSGRLGDAHRVLTAVDDFPRDGMWTACMCVAAQACVEAGDEAVAAHLLELLSPYEREWAAFAWAATWGPVALWLGELAMLLGRWDDAVAWLDPLDASAAPAWDLRVRFARARLRGVEPPRGELDFIVREARALGMKHLAAQAMGARVAPPA